MKNLLYFLALLLLAACNAKPSMPDAPASTDAAAKMLAGKNWVVVKTGTLSPFKMNDKPGYNWLDEMKEADDFIKKTLSEVAAIHLNFVSDTLVNVSGIPDSPAQQKYSLAQGDEGDLAKITLKFTYEGPDPFGGEGKMKLTYSYPVLGLNDKFLILATPRSVNDMPIVVLMEAK